MTDLHCYICFPQGREALQYFPTCILVIHIIHMHPLEHQKFPFPGMMFCSCLQGVQHQQQTNIQVVSSEVCHLNNSTLMRAVHQQKKRLRSDRQDWGLVKFIGVRLVSITTIAKSHHFLEILGDSSLLRQTPIFALMLKMIGWKSW